MDDDQERHGLLNEEPDAQQRAPSPFSDEGLSESSNKQRVSYKQAGILVFANATVIAAFQVIYPFINQMVVELGVANGVDQAGYYTGVFESALALAGFVTTIPCSYASDAFGRKPVLIASMLGTMVSLYFFGISTSFMGILISRAIGGAFGPNWTWAASFTILGEITDPGDSATVYSGINIGYSIGMMISPPIGGFLVHPSDHFTWFRTDYWKSHPYVLPSYTGMLICAITIVVIAIGLNETLPSKREWTRKHERQASASAAMRASMYSTHTTVGVDPTFNAGSILSFGSRRHTREATDDSEYGAAAQTLLSSEQPVTVWSVITPATTPVLISTFALSFLAAALFTIFPLWAFTPIEKGGLGATEASIGVQLSIRGLLHVVTLFAYPPAEKWLGLYKLYAWSMALWAVSVLGYPLLNLWARANGSADGFIFQVLMWTWMTIWSVAGFNWAGSPQMINRVSPSEAALARIVGVSNICILLGGTVGPVFATSLFQWSISLQFMSGNIVWVVMFALSAVATWHAFLLREPLTDRHAQFGDPLNLSSVGSVIGSRRRWEE